MIQGIKISSILALIHLLFVDDVVLFGVGTLKEWWAFDVILALWSSASSMCISVEKSSFMFSEVEDEVLNNISEIMPFKMDPIMVGFRYLGYFFKPLGYGIGF